MKTAKVLLSIIMPLPICALSWRNYYPAVAHALSRGENIPVWLTATIIFLTPFLIFAGIGAFDKYLHNKEGHKLTLGDACFKISLAATPLALNAMALLILPAYNVDNQRVIANPFIFFAQLLITINETGIGIDFLKDRGGLFEGFGLAWVAFFLIYSKLSRLTRQRLALAIIFIPIFVTGVSIMELYLIIEWIGID
jgi:hypothetical protein